MFSKQFFQALIWIEMTPFVLCLFIGFIQLFQYDLWVSFKVWLFTFIVLQPFFLIPKWRLLKSLAKGNRL
ncbi:hypothetical protein A5320_04040 [Rheinheimera sp. SA_1]|nr:hypothetical protein A5320_04040 [Rheinheimera sp. SA_1]